MPLNQYGILKGRAVAAKREQDTQSPHYQVHIVASDEHYRIAVNVMSVKSPSELLFIVDDSFEHPITKASLDLRMDSHCSKASRASRHSTSFAAIFSTGSRCASFLRTFRGRTTT